MEEEAVAGATGQAGEPRCLSSTMINVNDIYWSAGFLDGEGCFHRPGRMLISAAQKDIEPLKKLQSIWGGSINLYQQKGRANPIHQWHISGGTAAGIMMTLYSLLSTRRQQVIEAVISNWKTRRGRRMRGDICIRGHRVDFVSTAVGRRNRCPICAGVQIVRKEYDLATLFGREAET